MLTDLVQIERLGARKREENFRLRAFLKSRGPSDRILRRIAERVEEQIDCRVCANCCRRGTVGLDERDIERLAKFLRISRAQFVEQYTQSDPDEGSILRRSDEAGCVFLDGFDCTVYEARPGTCQRYPHLVRSSGSIASRMWSMVDRAEVCPIVYNTLEAFKQELRFR